MPPYRVVFVTRVIPQHSTGGMQVIAWDLAVAMARAGHDVSVLTAEVAGQPEEFMDAGVRVVALSGTSWRSYGHRWWIRTLESFKSRFAAKCDVVISVSAAGFGLLSDPSLESIPFVLQAHGTSLGEIISKLRSKQLRSWLTMLKNLAWLPRDIRAYQKFSRIVVVGPKVLRDISRVPYRWVLDQSKVTLIPNGVDTSRFRTDLEDRILVREELGWDVKDAVVICVGRLHKQKGVDLGVMGFARAAADREDLRLLILGDGPERDSLEHQVDALDLKDRVLFKGDVDRNELPRYLRAADIMLFTTTHVEVGLPLNVLEAMATGLPVVASEHLTGIGECGPSITAVNPWNAEDIAAAIQRSLSGAVDEATKFPESYSLKTCVASYLALIEQLTSDSAESATEKNAHA